MTNPRNGSARHTPDDDAAAIALIAAVDRFLSAGCPLHPEPHRSELETRIEETLSPGVNCPICNSSY